MIEFQETYFSLTNAEDQENYFTGDIKTYIREEAEDNSILAPGKYRVMDGDLYKIIGGHP